MKKILNSGEIKYTIRCPHCGCYFSYEDEDVELILLDNTNTNNWGKYVDCPTCKCSLKHTPNGKQHHCSNIETVAL